MVDFCWGAKFTPGESWYLESIGAIDIIDDFNLAIAARPDIILLLGCLSKSIQVPWVLALGASAFDWLFTHNS